MKKLTISIVNYNTGDYLIRCLESLEKAKNELDFDVFVVDNNSSDNSMKKAEEAYPNFGYIKNLENLGFGRAHNLVLEKAETPYILTLNPDCEVPAGVLSYMFGFMEKNPDVGLSTCKIEKADGTLDIASHRGFPTPKASFLHLFLKDDSLYHLTDRDMTRPHEIDSAVGAFMFIRNSVLKKIGYFDEDYFLYAEDIDLCFRIKEAGQKIMYLPDVKIVHAKGVSSGIKKHSRNTSTANAKTRNLALDYFYKTMIIFYKKHYAKKYPFFFNWAVYFAINTKWFFARRKQLV
ncbi:MAG: glycosyltransferase family 2 protein [Patescibacteria group bacterium]